MKQYILISHNHNGSFSIANVVEGGGKEFVNTLYLSDSIYFDEIHSYRYRDTIKYISDKEIRYKYNGDPNSRLNGEDKVKEVIERSINKCNQAEKLREFLKENNIDENIHYMENILRMY